MGLDEVVGSLPRDVVDPRCRVRATAVRRPMRRGSPSPRSDRRRSRPTGSAPAVPGFAERGHVENQSRASGRCRLRRSSSRAAAPALPAPGRAPEDRRPARPASPSETTASFGIAPMAARSETLTARVLWPRLSQSVQSRRKWTSSTRLSVVTTTRSPGVGCQTAASSPIPSSRSARLAPRPEATAASKLDQSELADIANTTLVSHDLPDISRVVPCRTA